MDIINSDSFASENRQNVTSPLSPQNPTSMRNKNLVGKDAGFVKRGLRKKTNIMEEAVEALKKISDEKMPILHSPQGTSNTADACEHLGLFIAARLREMKPDIRLRCEMEIMKILNTVASIETQEKYT